MTIRFYAAWDGQEVDVEYGSGTARIPVVGEVVRADGMDPEFPQGDYEVRAVHWDVGQRGPTCANVYLRRSGV